MDASDAFRLALGLRSPFVLSGVEMRGDTLVLFVDYERGVPIEGCGVHDTVDRKWRHADFFQYACEVHAKIPRVRRPDGSVDTVEVPWARTGSGFTKLFESRALELCRKMPVESAAGFLRIHDTRLWRLVHSFVERQLALKDLSALKRVGLDETSARRGHDYISVFVDLDSRAVVYVCEGRSGVALVQFREFLKGKGVSHEQIEEFCTDMSPSYLLGVKEAFPTARITLDKFHLVALVSEAVDETRRKEAGSYKALKGLRYALLKNPQNLKDNEREAVKDLFLQTDYSQTAKAYSLRLQFQELFTHPKRHAGRLLELWIQQAKESGIQAMKRVAATFETKLQMVLNWFQTRISNGILEGLHSVLQATKNKARGYRNPKNLIAMSYLLHGKLGINPL